MTLRTPIEIGHPDMVTEFAPGILVIDGAWSDDIMVHIAALNPHSWIGEIQRANQRGMDYSYPDIEGVCSYGVVDSPEQFAALFGEALESDGRDLSVTMTAIDRAAQSERGGWRWHKWGTYYGTQAPEHEYLFDDTHIDRVFIFSITDISEG